MAITLEEKLKSLDPERREAIENKSQKLLKEYRENLTIETVLLNVSVCNCYWKNTLPNDEYYTIYEYCDLDGKFEEVMEKAKRLANPLTLSDNQWNEIKNDVLEYLKKWIN